MKRPLLVVLLVSLLTLSGALPTAAASVSSSAAGGIPRALRPPPGQELVLKVIGRGSQNYVCDQATGRWTFRDPTAILNRHRRAIGIHYAGPTWELFDGSGVRATVTANVAAPDPTVDIPWLLLQSTERAGSGLLSGVDYIQRLHTRGGVAPDGGTCDRASDRTIGVPYTAVYKFFADGR
jgi:FtsP/CotA-like multicopper oxidase with cupredoxin domain